MSASTPIGAVEASSQSPQRVYRFADLCLDEANRLLTRDGKEISIPARSFDSLLVLVRNAGQLVTKDEMMDAVWSKAFVEESNLTVAISTLRRALGEDPSNRKLIQTVSGRGYRFIGEVTAEAALPTPRITTASVVATPVEQRPPSLAPFHPLPVEYSAPFSRRRALYIVGAFFALLVLADLAWFIARPTQLFHSVVILPVTGSAVDDYVLLGLTDTLISRVEGTIEVRPTSSVLKYSSAPADPSTVGKEQGADVVVTSTIAQDASGTHLDMRLTRTSDAKLLWSKNVIENSNNIAKLETVAGNALDAELAKLADHHIVAKATAKGPANEQAYELYLRGRYFWNRRTEEGLRQSIDYFRQSINADPNYALAYAGLADSYALLSSFSIESGRTAIPDARAAALSAIQLDPTLAEPHASLGMIYFFTDWDGHAAEREFERAIALNPNYATAHHWYGLDLAAMGRFPQALYEIRRAQALDPMSLIIDTNVGWIEFLSRNNAAAMQSFQKVLELDPNFVRALTRKGIVEMQSGDARFAVADLTKASSLSSDPYILGLLGEAQAQSGATPAAERTLKQLQSMASSKYVPPFAIALVQLGLGNKADAIKLLQQSTEDRSTSMVYAKIDPSLDALRNDPAFQSVIAGMRF